MASEVAFEVAKDELTSAVSWVARSLPNKPSLPVLRGMVIEASGGQLSICGYDFEVFTHVTVNANVTAEGTVAIAGKLMAEICANLPGDEISFKATDSTVVVESLNSRFELPTLSVDDYPALPDFPEVIGTINASTFVDSVGQVAPAATRDDNLPMLTGVNMTIKGKEITLAATDRFRLAVRKLEWNPKNPEIEGNLLIPAAKLQEFTRIVDSGLDAEITLCAGSNGEIDKAGLFGVQANNRRSTTKMLDTNFPKTESLLPPTYTTVVRLTISQLQAAIRRVSLVGGRNGAVRFDCENGVLSLSTDSHEAGSSVETIDAQLEGLPIKTAFNSVYFKDGLSTMDSDSVILGFTESTRPAVMIPGDQDLPSPDADGNFDHFDSDFIYLLMPVRLTS
ncbi:MAG: DNA polymerase III subunit beta [Corynebacterium sp.]|nr:DNA polymerase III subunit beta [Corynebacterium sp.]